MKLCTGEKHILISPYTSSTFFSEITKPPPGGFTPATAELCPQFCTSSTFERQDWTTEEEVNQQTPRSATLVQQTFGGQTGAGCDTPTQHHHLQTFTLFLCGSVSSGRLHGLAARRNNVVCALCWVLTHTHRERQTQTQQLASKRLFHICVHQLTENSSNISAVVADTHLWALLSTCCDLPWPPGGNEQQRETDGCCTCCVCVTFVCQHTPESFFQQQK